MLTITVTTCNTKKGLRDLLEFEKALRDKYEILCRSRYRKIYSRDSYTTGSDNVTVNAYPTAVNDQITYEYAVQ